MSTTTSYNEFILENIIKQILYSGQSPTTELIDSMYETFINGKDFTQPLFDNSTAEVATLENASAAKYNETNFEIQRDLQICYDTMFDCSNRVVKNFDRWRSASLSLETKLRSLDQRLNNLLQTQLHLGTHYISEIFHDASQVDLTQTTAYVNLKNNNVSLNTADNQPTRINLNYMADSDITFTVLSRTGLQNVVNAPGTDLVNIFNDLDNFWQSRVYMTNTQQPVSAELKAKISTTAISISKISLVLHTANTNAAIQITPMISSDGINFTQLNTDNYTVSVDDQASWTFPSINVTDIKFIMTKNGFDFNDSGSYIYEFGFQEIAIYNEGFDATSETLFSQSLFVPDINQKPIPYVKASIEVCDDIPANTQIQYYLAALQNPSDTPVWVAVDPTNYVQTTHPTEINFGDKSNIELDNVEISFDASQAPGFVNPAPSFHITTLISDVIGDTVFTTATTRYILFNSNDRLLNYEIDGNLDITDSPINIFRNVGAIGDTIKVRGIQRGWTFADPYYTSAIEVQSPNGISINFGQQNIILDNVLTSGNVKITTGVHSIQVHKNNWIAIANGITDIVTLKNTDPLFPFNHKLLIEGYVLSDPQNPYKGVDVFAGYYMKQTPIVNFIHDVADDDYSQFATDTDAVIPDKVTPSTIFVVKSDENTSDFLDELFTIRINVTNQSFGYVKLKAVLSSSDNGATPVLQSYQIKLSS